jgi:hypothetical protein
LVETSRVEDSGCGFGGRLCHAPVCATPPCPALSLYNVTVREVG